MDGDDERFERVPLSEWRRLRSLLEQFCTDGVTVEGGRLICRCGVATFTVDRDGDIEAGMPLHGFSTTDVETVGVDVDHGELLVETAGTQYVFRRP